MTRSQPMKPRMLLEDPDVRPDYRAGTWDYARGQAATEHPQYREAVAIARRSGAHKFDPGWIRTATDVRAVLHGCWFNEARGRHFIDFCSKFVCHAKGDWTGKPFVPMDWQTYDVGMPLFGWMREGEGLRRYKRGSVWIPKKNGKTTFGGAITDYMLAFDEHYGAECYSAACKKEQAARIFRDAAAMISKSPRLREMFKVIRSTKSITFARGDSFYKALSADAGGAEGLDIHLLLFDEIHALATDDLWNVLFHGDIAQTQSLFLSLSTAGEYKPTGVGWKEWDYALRIQMGLEKADEYFSYVARIDPEKEDWEDPACWKRANPSWGVTVRLEEMAEKWRRARSSGLEASKFRRYRLNIWEYSVSKFLDLKAFAQRCAGPIDWDQFKGLECGASFDLSAVIDLTALGFLFGPDPQGIHFKKDIFFMPETTIAERELEDHVPYRQWVAEGHIIATPGDEVDYSYLVNAFKEQSALYKVADARYDPWNAYGVEKELSELGHTLIPTPQTISYLSAPTKQLKRLVSSGKYRHGDNPVALWMAGNLVVTQDRNQNVAPHKAKSTGRIDGMMTTIMCLDRLLRQPETKEKVYTYSGMFGDEGEAGNDEAEGRAGDGDQDPDGSEL